MATTKINLTEKYLAHNAQLRAEKKAIAVDFVEKALTPHLITLAEKGTRFAVITPPKNVYMEDVITALCERVECVAKPNGLKGRINISW